MNKQQAVERQNQLKVERDHLSRRIEVATNVMADGYVQHQIMTVELAHLKEIIDAQMCFEPDRYDSNHSSLGDGTLISSSSINNGWRLQGGEWPTERDAKIASLRIKILNYLGHARLKLCPDFVEDWENENQLKYTCGVNGFGGVCFDTKKNALQAAEWVKPFAIELDKFMKLQGGDSNIS